MNKEIFFSIAIPAYKCRFFKEAIDSVLSQSYPNWELVIVDDASPEDLNSVVREFDDCRIRYYRNEKNIGAENVVDNWNKCLDYVKGDYVICMGDDDKLLPNCLQTYRDLIKHHPGLGLYHGWTEIIDSNSVFYDIQPPRPEYEDVYSLIWNRWNNRDYQFIGDFLFDTKTLRKNGGFHKLPMAWGSDDISAVIAASKFGVANTQELVFQYRVNPLSITSTGNSKLKIMAILEERKWYNGFLQRREPLNDIERKYYQVITNNISKHFDRKIGLYLGLGMRMKLSTFWHFIKRRRKYNFNAKVFLYAILVMIKTQKK